MSQEPAPATDQTLLCGLRGELQSKQLLPGLTCGTLMGAKEIIFALSIGSLVFSGELSAYLPYGIGIALLTQVIVLVGIALGSSAPGVLGGLQDSSSVILAVIAVSLLLGGGIPETMAPAAARSGGHEPVAWHTTDQEASSGGRYRLTSLTWQVTGMASGGGYRLLVPEAPSLRGSGCCCTYLPMTLRNPP